MDVFRLPPGWVGIQGSRWLKPYGWCDHDGMRIEVYAPKWIPPWFGLRTYFAQVIWNHEALHAWGNPGCGTWWCLGFEGRNWQEYLAMPVQLLAGLKFCDRCRGYYKGG